MEAYFRVTQKQSGGGGGATITVTYTAAFYNKTITCSDGITTYTAITTSSGSTTFNVNAGGTWTITCNGATKTVAVVLDYQTSFTMTSTINVYSAANDTISFTDAAGSKTVQTDSSGHGSVSITFAPGSSITFTSTVANDPDNLSNSYSKQITINSDTTSVYVMPDNVLYWYGYINGLQTCSTANGWSWSQTTYVNPTYNTNNILLNVTAKSVAAVGNASQISASKFYAVLKGLYAAGDLYGYFETTSAKVNLQSGATQTQVNSSAVTKYEVTPASGQVYVDVDCALGASGHRSVEVYAIWYDE